MFALISDATVEYPIGSRVKRTDINKETRTMQNSPERFWRVFAVTLLAILVLFMLYQASITEGLRKAPKAPSPSSPNFTTRTGFPSAVSKEGTQPADVYWIADLVQQALPFVVQVKVESEQDHSSVFKGFNSPGSDDNNPFTPFGFEFKVPENLPKVPIQGVGSGFILSEDGYIVTNAHVIQDADKITVTMNDGTTREAKLVGTDPIKDIAVLSIKGDNLPRAVLGDSEAVRIGEPAIAIGSPFGLEATVTAGIISTTARDPSELQLPVDARRVQKLIQTDAALNRGSSGGPLLNARGEVIGVNQAIIPYAQRIGFAIPINEVKSTIDLLIKEGKVSYPVIGVVIQEITKENYEELKIDLDHGVYVWQVNASGPADKAGVDPGDVILQINDVKIEKADDLINEMQKHQVGDRVTLLVVSAGKKDRQTKVAVILGELDTKDYSSGGK